ncbi:MAG: Bor/Iss family lipoprotein [Gemmatimonadaceae bacterium]
MRFRSLALAAASLALAGCYRVTVVHNPAGVSQAASAASVDKPFSNSFIYGLVPPAEINTKDQCRNGVSKVVTEHSFVNGLVAAVTWSIYTPIHVTVTCR